MKYLLDSNVIIAVLQGHPAVLNRLRQHHPADFGISAIAAHELFYGAFKSSRPEAHLAKVDGLQFEVLEFDREDARRAGQLRAWLAQAGAPIGPYDVLIAGQALARGLILVTHNLREFTRAPGLQLEDWQTD